jgi:DNA-binding SARP family transcriptional activator
MKSLCLKLFGGFHACDAAEQEVTIAGTKSGMLLAYLALKPDKAHSREQLIGLFWSDRGDSQARGSLRQTLWLLGKGLKKIEPYPLVVEGNTIALDPDAVEIDTSRFVGLIAKGAPDDLSSAMELYRGELLQGVRVRDPTFEDCLRSERSRFEELAINACTTLLDHQLTVEKNDEAAVTAKKLLEIDPLQEVAHRTLMRQYATKGQVGLAIKQYETCREILQRELRINPGPETERLFDRIRLGHSAKEASVASPDEIVREHHGDMGNRRTSQHLDSLPSIATLPFRTPTADPEQVILADGLRMDIQYALVKIASMLVVGTSTTNTYRNKDVMPQQAAAEMGVRYLLEGFVQKSGNRARITASLIDGLSGQVMWTEQYNRVLDDTLEVQDQISEKIVTALDVKLVSGEHARVWRKTLKNQKAREHFYRGIHEYMKRQREANLVARENFEQVALLAPESYLGPTMVAFTHWWDAFHRWTTSPARSIERAEQWAERALAMEDCDGQAHTVMAHIHLLRREHDSALELAQQAVALRPSCMDANPHLGNILYYCGRPGEAVDRMRQAMRLTPIHGSWFDVVLAAACKEIGQWDEATTAAKQALRNEPDDLDARLVLIEVCRATGDEDLARELVNEISALWPEFSLKEWSKMQPYRDPAVLKRIVSTLGTAGLAP